MAEAERYIIWLDRADAESPALVGSKAANLARLSRTGLPVPDAFCISTRAYHDFFAASGWPTSGSSDINLEEMITSTSLPPALAEQVLQAYRLLCRRHGSGVKVAVRSSALLEDLPDASFAGQYTTVLNVAGEADLLGAIRQCWASALSSQVRAYRMRRASRQDRTAMAVIVQVMAPATQAGVAFTVDPISGRRDVTVVEATTGTGEALVSGQATPHRYIFQRGDSYPAVADDLLDGARLAAVVSLAQKVELCAGRPQDVEWALDHAGRIYLLQARPITTITRGVAPEGTTHWTRDNVGEVIPDPVTPLSWSVLDPLANHSYTDMLRRLGVGNVPDTRLFDRFYGRVYLNQSLFQLLMARFYPSHAGWLAAPRLCWTALKTLWALHRLPGEGATTSRAILEQHHSEEKLDPGILAQAEMFARLADWYRLGAVAMEIHLSVTVLAGLLYQALDKLLAHWIKGTATATAANITTGLTGVRSAEAGQALAALSQRARQDESLRALVLTTAPAALAGRLAETDKGRALWEEIQSFLAQYGYAALQEFELAAPRWRDDPAIILGALQAQVCAAAEKPTADLVAARLAAIHLIESQLGPAKRWLFRRLLHRVQVFTVVRENLKYHVVIAHGHLRDIYLALADWLVRAGRLADTSDIFFLTAEEVSVLAEGRLSPDEGRGRIATRRQASEADRKALAPPAFDQLDGRLHPVAPLAAPASGDGPLLRGVGASPGTYVGRARVLRTLGDGARIEPGEVLIAPATSPGWAPLLLSAGALVTEIGGLLSHGAIIAREYGLPAVLNVSGATHCIHTGQLVYVDGSQGTVRLLRE